MFQQCTASIDQSDFYRPHATLKNVIETKSVPRATQLDEYQYSGFNQDEFCRVGSNILFDTLCCKICQEIYGSKVFDFFRIWVPLKRLK